MKIRKQALPSQASPRHHQQGVKGDGGTKGRGRDKGKESGKNKRTSKNLQHLLLKEMKKWI
eukprot:12897320-Prorocentrum_lima.AAC.1